MTKTMARIAIALLGITALSTVWAAEDLGSVTVQASRMMQKSAGKTASGIPIEDVSLAYAVSAKDLDLASHAGALELQKRVSDAALKACTEIGRQYPDSLPNTKDCARASTDKAMVKANELIAAAAKKPLK
jgi:UrcA family protein